MSKFLCFACGWIMLGLWGAPAAAQVWIDASQLGERVPDWVDAKLYHPTPPATSPQPSVSRIWVAPVYRTVCKQIWCEPVYQTLCERSWVEGHYESRPITTYDDLCGCPTTRYDRVWVPGHYITSQHQVCITPGRWETIETRECISSGHWENVVVLRD